MTRDSLSYYGNEAVIENSLFNLAIFGHSIYVCSKFEKKSRYKTNCYFEPVIPHYIAGVGKKYISHIGSVAVLHFANIEYMKEQINIS